MSDVIFFFPFRMVKGGVRCEKGSRKSITIINVGIMEFDANQTYECRCYQYTRCDSWILFLANVIKAEMVFKNKENELKYVPILIRRIVNFRFTVRIALPATGRKRNAGTS